MRHPRGSRLAGAVVSGQQPVVKVP